MSDRFDPEVLWRTLPSFFRERLGSADRAVISSLWEGMIRILDADYARATQLFAAPRARSAKALLKQPWVAQTFDPAGWTVRGSRHRHALVRLPGDSAGVFYLGRYFDLKTLKVWYDGFRIDVSAPSIVSNAWDGPQLAGTAPFGTRIEFRRVGDDGLEPDPSYFDPTKELTVEGEETIDRVVVFDGTTSSYTFSWWDGAANEEAEVDDALIAADLDWLDAGELGVAIDDVAAERPLLSWPDGFRAGQAIDILRTDGSVTHEVIATAGTTYRLAKTKTEAGGADVATILLTAGIRLWPDPVRVAADRITFPQPLPIGTRVRVTDPGGTQSFTVETPAAVLLLTRPADPATASVFVHNIDLTKIVADKTHIDFGRPPRPGAYVWIAAKHRADHDHARYAEVLVAPTYEIMLPTTRPLALTAGLVEDPRYPVRVYVDGRLLESAHYEFPATTRVRFVEELQIGQRVDVVYVDAETVEEHAHVRGESEAGALITTLTLPEPVEARYPLSVERRMGALFPAANAAPAADGTTVRLSPPSSGKFYFEGAVRGRNFRYLVPGRVHEADGWRGSLAGAEALQDGIDAPDVLLTGDDLKLVRVGDDTLIETAERLTEGWFKNALLDEHLLSEALGLPLGLPDRGASTERYRRLLLALYAAFIRGSQAGTLENFACIALGSDYAPRAGQDRGAVRLADQRRVRRVEADDGTVDEVLLSDLLADRTTAGPIPLFHAVSAYCRVLDREDIPWLPFFAEALSPDYRYAKRLDVRKPREFESVPTAYDRLNFVLEDLAADFRALEVWKNDLIWLRTTGVTTDAGTLPVVEIYARVEEVLDAHRLRVRLTLNEVALGWGEPDGYGETTGWGGVAAVDGVERYRIWTRVTRPVDARLHLDEMPPASRALADGETFDRVQPRLAELLRRTWFGVKIGWEAQRDRAALDDLRFFLERAKPAEVGVCPWTEVNDDAGIKDAATIELRDREPAVDRPLRRTYVGLGYVGAMFVAPTLELVEVGTVAFDANWWIASGEIDVGYIGTNTAVGSTVLTFFV